MKIFKKYFFLFILSLLISFTILEVLFQLSPVKRNIVDCKLHEISKHRGKTYKNIILGSSVTHGALGNDVYRYDGSLNLTTVGAVTVAGNYFMLKRVIENGNSVANVFLFVVPDILRYNFNPTNKRRLEYFNSIFTNESEVEEILKATEKSSYNAFSNRKTILEIRSTYLGNLQRNTRYYRQQGGPKENLNRIINNISIPAPSKQIVSNTKIQNRLKNYNKNFLSDETIFFLNKFIQITKENNINFTIILSPLQDSVFQRLSKTTFINNIVANTDPSINFVLMNNYNEFPAYAFKDKLHLKPKWARYYRSLIFSKIVPQ